MFSIIIFMQFVALGFSVLQQFYNNILPAIFTHRPLLPIHPKNSDGVWIFRYLFLFL
jgi:hypothetical protein